MLRAPAPRAGTQRSESHIHNHRQGRSAARTRRALEGAHAGFVVRRARFLTFSCFTLSPSLMATHMPVLPPLDKASRACWAPGRASLFFLAASRRLGLDAPFCAAAFTCGGRSAPGAHIRTAICCAVVRCLRPPVKRRGWILDWFEFLLPHTCSAPHTPTSLRGTDALVSLYTHRSSQHGHKGQIDALTMSWPRAS